MKRLGIGLAALATSGCIFLTPPTGLRLGDHSQEFASGSAPSGNVATVNIKEYDAPDFAAFYPDFWGVGTTDKASGPGATMRVSIGVRDSSSGAVEDEIVTEIDQTFPSDPTQAVAALATLAKQSLSQSYANYVLVKESATTLGGEAADQLELTGTDASTSIAEHALVVCTVHNGKGYVVLISTIASRFASFEPLYLNLFQRFAFRNGSSPSPSGSPGTQASASPKASASPSAAASGTSPVSDGV